MQKLIVDGKVSATTAREAIKQGNEGIKALKEAAQKVDAQPEPAAGKNGKVPKPAKKKVTAKKLRGTAAEKKPKVKKAKDDEITFTIKKYEARLIADALAIHNDTNIVPDETIKSFVTTLETALL